MANSFDETKALKLLISQVKTLRSSVERVLNDSATETQKRFVSFKMYAETYNNLASQAERILCLPSNN